MSILNSSMFKSSGSPPLSLQKQLYQFKRGEKHVEWGRENRTLAKSWFFFFPWPGKKRHLWSECAWGSTVCFHFKPTWQTNSDRFVPLFSLLLLLSLSLSNYEKTYCTNLLVLLVGLYVQLQHLRTHARQHTRERTLTQAHTGALIHTHVQTNLHKMTLTIDICNNGRKLKDTVPSQFTDTTNGFLAAPWNQAAVMSMHQQWEEGEPSP